VDCRAYWSLETVPPFQRVLTRVSRLLQFVEGPTEFLWGVVFVLLAVQVPVALHPPVVGLWCSLWLPRVAVRQQVACSWGFVVSLCMSCLSYHLA